MIGAGGGKGVMIMLTDYSNGNDMIVGKPGIKTLKDLKGKKVGDRSRSGRASAAAATACKEAGMNEKDVTLVNAKTNETPQVLCLGPGRRHRRLAAQFRRRR